MQNSNSTGNCGIQLGLQLVFDLTTKIPDQWWILGEASEAIASGPLYSYRGAPLFENAACSFILWYFTWFHEPEKLSKVWSFQQIGEMYVT